MLFIFMPKSEEEKRGRGVLKERERWNRLNETKLEGPGGRKMFNHPNGPKTECGP